MKVLLVNSGYWRTGRTEESLRPLSLSLQEAGIPSVPVSKLHETDGQDENIMELLESGKLQYIISTSSKGRLPGRDSVKIRRKAVELAIPCLTSIDTANALANSLRSRYTQLSTELVDINHMRTERRVLHFTKMQGCGNDYIYFNCFQQEMISPESLAVYLSDRHFGIGGDGVVMICPSDVADAKMRMFNLDGSEGKMCGNAIRCVGKYLYDHGMVVKTSMTIETLSGIKSLKLYLQNGRVDSVTVDMGPAELEPSKIPVSLDGDRVVNRTVSIGGKEYAVTCVSMGNPHCVVFCDPKIPLDTLKLEELGPQFEFHPLFPERVNTEFITVLGRTSLKMRVWERGSGETWACGTGACAAAVAAVLNGYCLPDEEITVKLKGGDLMIRYTGDTVYMTGKAAKVFEGDVEI